MNDPKDEGDLTRAVLSEVGPRLRAARLRRSMTLDALAVATGVSASTLSRLESGKRTPNLELLLPVTPEQQIGLDNLMIWHAAPPRSRSHTPVTPGMTVEYLSPPDADVRIPRMVIPSTTVPSPKRSHGGFQTAYVLRSKAKINIGDRTHIVEAGQAFEFDTRLTHSIVAIGRAPVEVVTVHSRDGTPIRPANLTATPES